MVEAGKIRLTRTILVENGKSPLTASAFQQLYLIFATVTSFYDLAIGALLTYQSTKLLSQSKSRVQKTLNLAFIIIGRLRVVLYTRQRSHTSSKAYTFSLAPNE
jgi:hypothetical protein